MAEIDAKLKEIEEFNQRNFDIDEEFLDLYADLFTALDCEIVSAPLVEYTKDNLPSYFPDNDVWFDQAEVMPYD